MIPIKRALLITRKFRAATMNGKFELSSNDYDESNLNRFHMLHGSPDMTDSERPSKPVAGAKLPVANSIQPDRLSHQAGSDGGKRNSSPGRARHKPSSHCAGNAGVLRLYLYARVRIYLHLAHETAGAASTRHSLLPLV